MRSRIIFSTLALAAFLANGTAGASDEPVAWDEFASRFRRAQVAAPPVAPGLCVTQDVGLVAV
ncbi:MAG: hypothetical protein IJR99_06740, partial [Kiritimatiellae bacterium]|nr:hypothetical protein [Kiritimatiellia bacterium]